MTKDQTRAEWINWILANVDHYTFFTVTASFRSNGIRNEEEKWIREYDRRIITKFNRQVSKRAATVLVAEQFRFYEFDQKSLFSNNPHGPSPHHIHGVIGIPKDKVKKVWDDDRNSLHPRLQKDLDTTQVLRNILVEPLDLGRVSSWVNYCTKSTISQM
jgi:hypothetical protein